MTINTCTLKGNASETVSDNYLCLDQIAQHSLFIKSRGVIHTTLSADFVDPSPLPWEYESVKESRPAETRQHEISIDEHVFLNNAVEILLPLLEDIILAGKISTRWQRAGANKATYFKCYHLYSPTDQNAPELAVLMRRPRVIPQRYAKKYAQKKRALSLRQRKHLFADILRNELISRAETDSLKDAVIDMHQDLTIFLAALISAASWDSYAPVDICAEIYRTRPGIPVLQLLEDNGCAQSVTQAVLPLIQAYKIKEEAHEAL